ncbi:hypothetical protein Tcan_04880 [Toxocara canis]|nr:hypothetical protein Tcan_04880 [Toxocara canis]
MIEKQSAEETARLVADRLHVRLSRSGAHVERRLVNFFIYDLRIRLRSDFVRLEADSSAVRSQRYLKK